jgi:hypothetical protein
MTRDRRLPVVAVALALAAGAVTLSTASAPLRPAVVLVFLAVGPGLALVGLLGLDDPLEELLLVVGASLVLDLLAAEALVLAGAWSAEGCIALLMAVAIAGAIVHMQVVPEDEP